MRSSTAPSQFVLRAEIIVDGGDIHLGAQGDLAHGRQFEALFQEHALGGRQNALSGILVPLNRRLLRRAPTSTCLRHVARPPTWQQTGKPFPRQIDIEDEAGAVSSNGLLVML